MCFVLCTMQSLSHRQHIFIKEEIKHPSFCYLWNAYTIYKICSQMLERRHLYKLPLTSCICDICRKLQGFEEICLHSTTNLHLEKTEFQHCSKQCKNLQSNVRSYTFIFTVDITHLFWVYINLHVIFILLSQCLNPQNRSVYLVFRHFFSFVLSETAPNMT